MTTATRSRFMAVLCVGALNGLVTPAPARADIYSGLILNASGTDRWAATESAPFQGERTLYLWYAAWETFEAFDFGLAGTLEIVSVTPRPGYALSGPLNALHVAASPVECIDASAGVVLAEVVVRDDTGTGGRVCFTESAETFRACGKDCHELDMWTQFHGAEGFGSDGGWCSYTPSSLCRPAPVEPNTWGRTKASYRGD